MNLREFPHRLQGWLGRRAVDAFLNKIDGVVHIGANTGQERDVYAKAQLSVLWIEPIPDIFEALCANIAPYPRQRALQYLLSDADGRTYDFHIANNGGASSSILDIAQHKDIWPEIDYVETIPLQSARFATMIAQESIDLSRYQGLIMDTQGSELLVLRGAGELIRRFEYIKTEAADFELYKNCCVLDELTAYLTDFGFGEIARNVVSEHPGGGRVYDLSFQQRLPG